MTSRRRASHPVVGQDGQAANFQPWGVRVHALRNSRRSDFGWAPISTSIAARPRISATSPQHFRSGSGQLALLYFTLPDFIDSSQLALVSVTPEECVESSSSCVMFWRAGEWRSIVFGNGS